MTFVDDLGREVSVPKNPERVAALLGSFADIWLLAGGELCAAAEDAWDDFGLELGDTVNLGGAHSPNLEKLVDADPQLVLASASTASNVDMRESLERMGIAVAYFDVDHFDDYLRMLKICTDITGQSALYEENGLAIQRQIEEIKAQFASEEHSEASRTVLLLRASSTSVKAKGSKGTILGEMLADMGCINIADSQVSLLENLSVEEVIKQNPNHIFVVDMGENPDAAQAAVNALMIENPAWGMLPAVVANRLHVMDKTLFNLKPNARWAEAYEVLYEILTK
ncbi:MAG: ABC transporter substrate-binding protein [Clostridia bacterium]|nr:ABC transporter substrate-binding protein [Clostridia bacterium]